MAGAFVDDRAPAVNGIFIVRSRDEPYLFVLMPPNMTPAALPAHRFGRAFGLVVSLLLATACAKSGLSPGVSHPALLAAESNRNRLVGQIVIANLDRTLATADALRTEGILPFGGAELRQMLVARLGIDPALFDLVDTSQPIGFAMIAQPPAKKPATGEEPDPFLAGSLTLKPTAATVGKLTALGTPAETRKQAQQFRRSDGSSIWLAQAGGTLLWSDSFDALAEAGTHAHAATQTAAAPGEDLVATFFPPALSAGDKQDAIKTRALSAYEAELRAKGLRPPPSERASVEAGLDFVLVPLNETDRVRVGLGLSGDRGFGISMRAFPRAGTAFAKRVAARAPYQLPQAAQSPQVVSILSFGPMPTWPGLVQTILDRQAAAGVPGAGGVATRLRALLPLLSGSIYQGARAEGDTLGLDWVVGLRREAAPTAAGEALAALASDPAFPLLLQQVWGRQSPQVVTKRQGSRVEVTLAFPNGAQAEGGTAAMARAFSGNNTVTILADAQPGRIVLSSEPGAAPRLASLTNNGAAGSNTAATNTAFGAAAAETAGREGVFFLDVWGFARPVLRAALVGNQRRIMDMVLAIPGLSSMSLPVWLSFDGGDAFAADLRVPIVTLKNASALMTMLGGAGTGAGIAP